MQENVKPLNGQATVSEPAQPLKKVTHVRLKVDLSTWHLTPFSGPMNFGPNAAVTGKNFGFLCFVILVTKN